MATQVPWKLSVVRELGHGPGLELPVPGIGFATLGYSLDHEVASPVAVRCRRELSVSSVTSSSSRASLVIVVLIVASSFRGAK